MRQNIHRMLIKRLALVWFVLSILISALVFYFSMNSVDSSVEHRANKEALNFSSPEISTFLNSATALQRDEMKTGIQQRLAESHFIVAELYNREKEKVIEVVRPGYQDIEDKVNKETHNRDLLAQTHHKTFLSKGRIYLQVFIPLTVDSENIGFFEGIYEVDEATMRQVTGEISRSILEVLFAVLATTVALYPVIISLNKHLIQHSKDLMRANIETLGVLGGAIAKRDSDTHEHNFRVTLYTIRLAETVGIDRSKIQGLIKGAFLHDVGKIAISDSILLKPGKLSHAEFITMQTHVIHGIDIIKENDWLLEGADVVRCHHEKFDGTGYPAGLKGKDIPEAARIFIICDVFDALSSERPYKKAYPLEKAIRILKEESGTRYDPALLQTFLQAAPSFYDTIARTDEKTLRHMLDQSILNYF